MSITKSRPVNTEPTLISGPGPHRNSSSRNGSTARAGSSTPVGRGAKSPNRFGTSAHTGRASTSPAKAVPPTGVSSAAAGKKRRASAPRHHDPDTNLTNDDAVEGTDAFRSRISEITSFRVVSRVRPFIQEELAQMKGEERRSVVEMKDALTILLDPKDNWAPKAQFEFDASFWSIPPSHNLVHTFQDTRRKDYATQKVVYDYIAKDLVPHMFNGYNSCILSYGQTGSGKTYTMMGVYDAKATCGGAGEEGIIPRVTSDLFVQLRERLLAEEEKPPRDRTKFRVEVSFVEIYMERVRDLLDPALRHARGSDKLQDARIRQDPYSGPFVEGVTKYAVENWAQCCTLLERGSMHRTTCATAVHNQSSRSHAIFQITLVQESVTKAKERGGRPTTTRQAGRINLVDLAGSERGGFQDYVKESAAINTSLLALRRVIDNLTERQNILIEQVKAEITGSYYQERPLPQVPYRDSVLTWLLSDSIGGNARTTMVATLSPLVRNYGDTLATLQWSSKARNLVTLVKVNDHTVQDGLASHAGQLGSAAQIQRGNLDSLRDTLKAKLLAASKVEKDVKTVNRALAKTTEQVTRVRRDRAAIIVQRAFRRHMLKKKLASYDAHHEKMRGAIGGDRDPAKMAKLRAEAEAKEEEARRRLKSEEQRTDTVASRCATFERNREALEARRAEADERYGRVREQIDADGIEDRHRQKVEQDVVAAKAKLEEAQVAQEARRAEVAGMRAAIDRSKQPGWQAGIDSDRAELAELRRKRDETKARRDAAVAERDAMRAKHDQVFKKK